MTPGCKGTVTACAILTMPDLVDIQDTAADAMMFKQTCIYRGTGLQVRSSPLFEVQCVHLQTLSREISITRCYYNMDMNRIKEQTEQLAYQ